MLTVLLGLTGALLYGSADFVGGLASRVLRPLVATAIASASGLAAVVVLAALTASSWSPAALVAGVLSGLAGAVAITMLYACLAIGPMSVLSPITAVVSAVVPVVWALVAGDELGPFGIAGLVLGVPAIVLVATVPGSATAERGSARRVTRTGLLLALGAGLGIGLMLVGFDAAPDDAGLTPLVAHRAVGVVVLGLGVLATLCSGVLASPTSGTRADVDADGAAGVAPQRTAASAAGTASARALRRALLLALGAGIVDALANACILIGTTTGSLTVVSVLTALYPAGTVLLAALVLRERILPTQWAGLGLALAASALLAL